MDLTHEDFQKAKRISEALQEFLLQTGMKDARSTDVYDMLARKGLVEKDRHNGYQFRQFLKKLKDANVLSQFIPQCTCTTNDRGENEWHFHASSKKTVNPANTGKPATIIHKPAMSQEDILRLVQEESVNVEMLPVRTDKIYTPQEQSIRKNYPRAFEYWTDKEYAILDRVYIQSKNLDVVAALLKRQPHIVKDKIGFSGMLGLKDQ
jgi:hypothetical protein